MKNTRACSYCGTGGLEVIQACGRCGNPYCIRHKLPNTHNCRNLNYVRFSGHVPGVYKSGMRDAVAVYTTGNKKYANLKDKRKAKQGGLSAWLAKLLGKSPGGKGAKARAGRKRASGKPGRKTAPGKKRKKK